MKLLDSTPITKGISYSTGYSKGCSVTIVHAKLTPTTVPDKQPHYHTKDSEYFYVLKGEITIDVEG